MLNKNKLAHCLDGLLDSTQSAVVIHIPDERTYTWNWLLKCGGPTSHCFCLESCNTWPSVRRGIRSTLNAREAFQQLAILFPFWKSPACPRPFQSRLSLLWPGCGSCLRPSYFCMFSAYACFSARNWSQWRSDRVYQTSAILSTWLRSHPEC